jgi:hypothetical protein
MLIRIIKIILIYAVIYAVAWLYGHSWLKAARKGKKFWAEKIRLP